MAKRNVVPKVLSDNGSYDELVFNKSLYATYASEDTSKGTIEERLSKLSPREGTITFESGWTFNYTLKRESNFCTLYLSGFSLSGYTYTIDFLKFIRATTETFTIGTLPEEFRPKSTTYGNIYMGHLVGIVVDGAIEKDFDIEIAPQIQLNPSGTIQLQGCGNKGTYTRIEPSYYQVLNANFGTLGYEAQPIK